MTNLALSALILILLLLPGSVFIQGLFTSFRSKADSRHVPFDQLLIQGFLSALAYHTTALCFIQLFRFEADLDTLYKIFAGKELTVNNGDFKKYATEFSTYVMISVFVAFVGSKVVRHYVHKWEWHIKYAFFNNSSYWFDIFSADYLEKRGIPGRQKDAHILLVNVLSDKNVIYTGFLLDFFYSPHNDCLEAIVLTKAKKKDFSIDGSSKERFVAGDTFVIPFKSIVNFNIYYVNLQNLKNPTGGPALTEAQLDSYVEGD